MIVPILVSGVAVAADPARRTVAPSPQEDHAIRIGERLMIHSAILNEDRPYLVYLPESYRGKEFAPKRYPVLYLLDGDAHFHSASGVVQFMSANINGNMQVPELIIIAIPNTVRTRDLTPTHTTKGYNGKETPTLASSGGGESFLRFLSEELLPQIEAEYRTQPYRLVAGHSFGGLFAMHAFLHRPEIFQAHIAIDPALWWDGQLLLRQATQMLQETNDFRGPVYISVANNPPREDFDPKLGAQACRDFADLLRAHNSVLFRSALQYFETEDHGSVPLLSLYHGLLFVFDGFKPPASLANTPAAVTDHFVKVSARLGFQVLPPEEFVNSAGWNALNNEHATNAALELLKFNLSNYPNSPNVYASLAEAYDLQDDKPLAIENYERALKLNPKNRYAAERLRRLKPFSEKARGPLDDGVYRLTNKATGEGLEVRGASTSDAASLSQCKYTQALNQQWLFQNQGDAFYQVTAMHSGKALDVTAASIGNGVPVIQWKTNGGANQIWQAMPNGDGTYRLLNEHSGLALQVISSTGTKGPSLEQWEWQGRDNQRWRIKRVSSASKNEHK